MPIAALALPALFAYLAGRLFVLENPLFDLVEPGQDLVDAVRKNLFGDFRGILSRAEIEFAEEEKDSGSEVVEGTEAARIGLDGLDA